MKPLVSLVILNYNGEKFIDEGLGSIVNCAYKNLEIILVDNCSTDNSVRMIQDRFKEITVIRNSENLGFAEGNNVGIRAANGQYICLLNNDLKVTEGWLNYLIEFLESNPGYAAAQPKILSWQSPEKFEYAGASGGYIDRFGIPFSRGRIMDVLENDAGQYNEPVDVFWASGAAICFKKEILDKVGFLDGDFYLHQEEIDFCWRILLAGFKIAAIPDSVVYHYGGASLNYESPLKLYLNYRNNLTMIIKNMEMKRIIKIFPFRIFQDMAALVFKILKGQISHSYALIRGYLYVLKNLKSILMKRKHIQNDIRKLSDDQIDHLVHRKSIVMELFFHRKKRFSELSFYPKLSGGLEKEKRGTYE